MMKKMSIHRKIREGRARLGMTEVQFGDAVGVSRGAVQQWEKEGGTAPSRKHQPAVAKILQISVSELMDSGISSQSLQQCAPRELMECLGKILSDVSAMRRKQVMPILEKLLEDPGSAGDMGEELESLLQLRPKTGDPPSPVKHAA